MHKIKWGKFCADHHKYEESLPLADIWDESEEEELPYLIENAKGQGMIHRDSIISVQGKEKEGKSTAALCFAMALLAGEFNGLKAHESNCKVLWIDTEMGIRECTKRLRKAMESMGLSKEHLGERLQFLTLKTKEEGERIKLTERAIKELYPDFVVLDGIADLACDVNDPKESPAILRRLGVLVEELHIALLTIIHENKNDDNSRGHLGSLVNKKAYELYSVKNGRVDYLRGRGEPCEGFSFGFGDGGIPVTDIMRNKFTECLEKWAEVFKTLPDGGRNASGYKHSELWKAYRDCTPACERSSKEAIKQAVKDGILIKEGKDKTARYKYAFPLAPTEFEDEVL